MIDLARVVGFDWDDGNDRKSLDKHEVSQKEAEEVFIDPALFVLDDVKHSHADERFQALGESATGRRLHVTFTLRDDGTRIRVISARPMNRKERTFYDQET
jgi:uncharacterized DUF497 family protein